MFGIFLFDKILSVSSTYLVKLGFMGCPSLKFKESDLLRSMGMDGFLLNQKCFLASTAVNLSGRFLSNRQTKSFADLPYLSQISSEKSIYPF